MYKPNYNLYGQLIEPLAKFDVTAIISNTLAAELSLLIGPEDWTYFKIEDNCATEIVRVKGVTGNAIYIDRGIDGTERGNFVAGAAVTYVATAAGVRDSVQADPLSLTGQEGVTVSGQRVSYLWRLRGIGGASMLRVEGEELIIPDRAAKGCCSPCEPPEISNDLFPKIITDSVLPTAGTNAGYSLTLVGEGGAKPYKWYLQLGSLPTGLILGEDGVIHGTTAQIGSFTFTIKLVDAEGFIDTKNFILESKNKQVRILGNVPDAFLQDVSVYAYTITGGTPPYTVTLDSGTIPPGKTLSPFGILSGRYTALGNYGFTVKVEDSATPKSKDYLSDSIKVISRGLEFENGFVNTTIGNTLEGIILLSGGEPPFTIDNITGTPPTGVVFNVSGTNIIASGTLTDLGTFSWTFNISSNDGKTLAIPQTVDVTTDSAIEVIGDAMDGDLGTPYSYIYRIHNDTLPSTIQLTSGNLPKSLNISVGTVTNPELLLTGTLPNAISGTAYNEYLDITGGNGIYSNPRIISGTLPVGLNLALIEMGGTWKLQFSGTPIVMADYTFTVAVDSEDYQTATSTQTISISAYISSLLHLTGTNGQTTFPDETGKNWYRDFGNPKISDAQTLFGGNSLYLYSSGIAKGYESDFDISSNIFTIQVWAYQTAINGAFRYASILSKRPSGGDFDYQLWTSNGLVLFTVGDSSGGAHHVNSHVNIYGSGWSFLEMNGDGTTVRGFINGTQVTSYAIVGSIRNRNTPIQIGRSKSYGDSYWAGYLREFRFIKGTCLHTSDYTPPTAPFPNP